MSDDYTFFWKTGLCDLFMNGGDLRDANRYFEVAFNAHQACLTRRAVTKLKEVETVTNSNEDDDPLHVSTNYVNPVPSPTKTSPIFKDLRTIPNTVVLVAGQEQAFSWDRTGILILAVGCVRIPDDIADEIYASPLFLWARVANVFIVANPTWETLQIKQFERLQNSVYVKTGTKIIWVIPDSTDAEFIKNFGDAKFRYTVLNRVTKLIHKRSYFEDAWLESEVKEAVSPFLPAQNSKKTSTLNLSDLEQF